jgi:hypothetical protein
MGILWPAESVAQEVISREYTIKAAYLYNFGRYVKWPDGTFHSDAVPFVIGVFGTDPFGSSLDDIAAAKNVDGRKIVLRRFSALNDYTPSQILFVPKSTDPQLQIEIIQKLRDLPVLLVGETPAFAQRGGTINFFIEENKLRFTVNQQAAIHSGLRISAKLLSLAKLIDEDTAGRPPADSPK